MSSNIFNYIWEEVRMYILLGRYNDVNGEKIDKY
jgi:hypothetical protein